MASALLLLADGFEEIEAITIADVLRRSEVNLVTASLSGNPVRGAHDIKVVPDAQLDAVKSQEFDVIVLPGGMPGSKNLREDPRVLELLRTYAARGKLVAAICAAPTALEAAGVLKGKRATSFPGSALPSAEYVEERVVEDGNIVTSRGPATAMDFALKLVERLVGRSVAETQRQRLLA
jgi:4-methyl-5(b-hydroxyethyl)-thiazole monophosphate biosynthesis